MPHSTRAVKATGNRLSALPSQQAPVAMRAFPNHSGREWQDKTDWRQQSEVKIRFSNAPTTLTTKNIWNIFSHHGSIEFIELLTDNAGNRSGQGYIRFSPPPKTEFWKQGYYLAIFQPGNVQCRLHLKFISMEKREPRLFKAPVNNHEYPERIPLKVTSIGFGYMHGEFMMKTMLTATPMLNRNAEIKLIQNLGFRTIDILFPLFTHEEGFQEFRLRFSHASKFAVYQPLSSNLNTTRALLVFSLTTPPELSVKYAGATTHSPTSKTWSSNELWFRHSNIVRLTPATSSAPTRLKIPEAIVDVGRWTTYLLEFDVTDDNRDDFEEFHRALHDFNIIVKDTPNFTFLDEEAEPIWNILDRPSDNDQAHSSSLAALMDDRFINIPFEIRYQLEVCIAEGCLNEYTIKRDFIDQLISLEPAKAVERLEDISTSGKRFYDPLEIFRYKGFTKKKPRKQKLPHFCTLMRSATITPTTVCPSTPMVEISNRVIRQYSTLSDRFLRVKFSDEDRGQLYSRNNMDLIYDRIRQTLANGITVADRHYEFLAFGNSQFREHGAYFYSPVPHVSPDNIRAWMGDFRDINQIAKYAARLGQCFSTTRAIHGARAQLGEMPDIMSDNGKYNFTDGVGKISKTLAILAAREMGLALSEDGPPSVLQFRLGGCKGVLAVWPQPNDYLKIFVRPSQYKFHAQYEGLEVIRWSQFSAAHLNQQIIAVLSCLGVKDHIFITKLKKQISRLAEAMDNEDLAKQLLIREVDPNQMTPVLAAMVSDGFQASRDPFMTALLRLWRAWNIKYLKEKAKIAIAQGAVLLGCTDESQSLKGHFEKLQPTSKDPTQEERFLSTPEVFVQLSKGTNNKPEVIEGYMLLARNPSLHPGDIRVVRGVDKPQLRHLKDVVVLPQTGDRDIASMCSGGDLDGDDYLVIWDRDLLPAIWNYPPMDYSPPPPLKKSSGVSIDDITNFFVEYMKNNNLPQIAINHRAQADASDDGIFDWKCVELAALHSMAVDFPKSGICAKMDDQLRPRKYPHFMGKPPDKSYKSTKVLGKLYDEVELVNFDPDYDLSFDPRILSGHDCSEESLRQAKEVKQHYDAAMYRIMQQYNIATEHEVWSTFVLSHAKVGSDFKFHETIGHLSSALKETYREECFRKAGGRDLAIIGPFVVAMYQITKDEYIEFQQTRDGSTQDPSEEVTCCETRKYEKMPMISFPWIFHDVLGRLATGQFGDAVSGKSTLLSATLIPSTKKKHVKLKNTSHDDSLETKKGVKHHGDALVLFTGEEPRQITNTGRLIDVDEELDLDGIKYFTKNENDVLNSVSVNKDLILEDVAVAVESAPPGRKGKVQGLLEGRDGLAEKDKLPSDAAQGAVINDGTMPDNSTETLVQLPKGTKTSLLASLENLHV